MQHICFVYTAEMPEIELHFFKTVLSLQFIKTAVLDVVLLKSCCFFLLYMVSCDYPFQVVVNGHLLFTNYILNVQINLIFMILIEQFLTFSLQLLKKIAILIF